jgi:hypothetical protein
LRVNSFQKSAAYTHANTVFFSVVNIFLKGLYDVSGKSRSSAISQLVSMNASQSVVKLIMQQQTKYVVLSDAFMLELMWLLAQLAQRGNRNVK